MRVLLAALVYIIGFYQPAAATFAVADGKTLHDNHCRRCHDESQYRSANSRLTDYQDLRAWVSQCELTAEAGWFEDEVDAVVDYLNKNFYRFNISN